MRILICDDHALIRSGIKRHFTKEPGYCVIGEAENGYDLIKDLPQNPLSRWFISLFHNYLMSYSIANK
jgi:DNA-binding NarL/FixJ family response regulator